MMACLENGKVSSIDLKQVCSNEKQLDLSLMKLAQTLATQVPRVKVGKKQSVATLIDEESPAIHQNFTKQKQRRFQESKA